MDYRLTRTQQKAWNENRLYVTDPTCTLLVREPSPAERVEHAKHGVASIKRARTILARHFVLKSGYDEKARFFREGEKPLTYSDLVAELVELIE